MCDLGGGYLTDKKSEQIINRIWDKKKESLND